MPFEKQQERKKGSFVMLDIYYEKIIQNFMNQMLMFAQKF